MRSILAVLWVLVLSGAAFAGAISDAAAQLALDVQSRLDAIALLPRTKELAAESSNLKKAAAKLAKYGGVENVAGLKVLAGAGKYVALSRTTDAAITADIVALLNAFLEGAQYRQGRYEMFKELLLDPKHLKALQTLEASALRTLEAAEAALATNPVRAATLLVKAYDRFGLISDRAKRFGILEDGSPPPDGLTFLTSEFGVSLVNTRTVGYAIDRIRVFGAMNDGPTLVRGFTGQSAEALVPGLFAAQFSDRILAAFGANPSVFDLTNVLVRLIPEGTVAPNASGEFHVYLKGRSGFFVVPFAVNFTE
jgi:hypothetical protein